MTTAEEKELTRMVREIYHHLGLDGCRVISLRESREQAENDVLKWKEKRRMKGHERATNI